MATFKVNKSLLFKVNKTNTCRYKKQKKNDNIFILTRDNFYFILEKKYLLKSNFFKNIFDSDEGAGYLRKPIFLQKVNSFYLKFIIQYLKNYEGIKENKWEGSNTMTLCDLYAIYDNDWDKNFIQSIRRAFEKDLEDFEGFLKIISYMDISNLYEKVKYSYDFVVNMKEYKLDEMSDCESEEVEEVEED